MRKSVAPLILAFALLLGDGSVTHACAPAPHAGDMIAIVEESAVIVWEPATKTEHFIRRATFRGKGRDFGFLVPTPTTPTLAEVDDSIFDRLEEHTKPERRYVTTRRVDWTPMLLTLRSMRRNGATSIATSAVEVLSTQKLAGYEAAVLEASDAAALQHWLSGHGYDASGDLVEWLDAYVSQHWKITAFKIDATQTGAQTTAVKMSFVTDRPFFPYREPASQRQVSSEIHTNRSLNVWFLGPDRVTATIGTSTFWPADLRRSDNLTDPLRADVARIAGVPLPSSIRMTAFADWSSIRPGLDDLFFAHSNDQRIYVPPPQIIETVKVTHIPLDLIVAAVIALALIVWRSRRLT
jgi:hypothetical protein